MNGSSIRVAAGVVLVTITVALSALPATACEWTSLGQRRAEAHRIAEGRVTDVRIRRVWFHDWAVQIDRVATVRTLRAMRGSAIPDRFEYRFSTHEDHGPDWACSGPPDRSVKVGETGYFLWENLEAVRGLGRPTLVLTPGEFRQRDLD